MTTWGIRGRSARRRAFAPATLSWPLALTGALACAQAAVLLLRPRTGLIAPDPVRLEDHFAPQEVARGRRYSRPQLGLGVASSAVQLGLLAGLARRPPRVLSRAGDGGAGLRGLARSAAAAAGLNAGLGLAVLPARVLAQRRARAYGLATQSWRSWTWDLTRGVAISGVLAAGAGGGVVALMRRQPRWWWLPGAGGMVVGAAAMSFAAPVLLDPVFNHFEPLPSGPLRDRVLDLAARAGVTVREVYEMDASRRTTAANAYVTGLGATKRVVLFDTLLSSFTEEEVGLVVAHELAHVRHRDVAHGLLLLALVAPGAMHAAAALTGALAGERRRAALPGPALLPALALALSAVSSPVAAIASQLSRRIEARADAFALRLTGAAEPFVSFERRIALQNLADPDPPRWLVALMASHPPTLERIGIARAYERAAG